MADQPQMAERQQTPALTSTADAAPYVPVSWMAVSAAVVAGLFLVVLVGLGLWDSLVEKKPLMEGRLLVFAVVGVVLSFAGRRLIRNSEGTRTGENLCVAAWWVSVIAGLSFGAYMAAHEFAVRRDAEDEGRRWVANLVGDNDAGKNAFKETLEPDRRPNSPGQLEVEFGDQLMDFKQCDLVRLAQRNPGDCRIEGGGVKDWTSQQNILQCVYTTTLKCREGVFPIRIPIRGMEYGPGTPSPGRKWLVLAHANVPMIQPDAARTPYGWLVGSVEQSAMQFGRDFFALVGTGSPNYPLIYHNFVGQRSRIEPVAATLPGRMALGGAMSGIAAFHTKESTEFFRTAFFKLPGGGEPSQSQKDEFRKAWGSIGLLPPATRLKNAPERGPLIAFADRTVEMEFPCELPIPGPELAVCKARLIVTLNDPDVLAELRQLRAEANPDQTTRIPPDSTQPIAPEKWRLVRVETDMQPVRGQRPGAGQPGQ